MSWLDVLKHDAILKNSVSTLALIVVLMAVRALSLSAIRHWDSPTPEAKRRWLVQIRNIHLLIFGFALVAIWAQEIRSFALSLVALAVAGVVATKELIACFLGGLLKAITRPFQIGDRIEVQAFRGDVIDHNLFTTTLFEVGPRHTVHQYTGRTIVVPNSVFLSNPLYNESFNRQYVLHTFTVPFRRTDHWPLAEKFLLEAAFREVGSYLAEAKQYMSHLERTQGLDAPVMDPRVTIHFPDPDRIDLVLRVPVPAQRKGKLEQAILRSFVEKWQEVPAPPVAQPGVAPPAAGPGLPPDRL